MVSRFLPRIMICLTDSVITRAVTLDIPRMEEEEEEKQTVDELQWKQGVNGHTLHVRAATSVITCTLSPIESRADRG